MSKKNYNNRIADTFFNPIVIIGTGPVGVRVANELLKIDATTKIIMYGDEPWEPYNRFDLCSLLADDIDLIKIKNPLTTKNISNLVQHHNCSISNIDRVNKMVTDSLGNRQSYSKLVLAIGSRPRKPNIPGIELSNIYTLRDLQDVNKLFARRMRTRHTIVIGGGLLGLEVAKAMKKHNTNVTIIEHSNHLMSKQLNEELSNQLLEELLALNIKVRLKSNVKKIIGDTDVTGIELSNGKTLKCDTIILATGIIANKKIAQNAGIVAGKGIRVNNSLQTSDPDIFAIGECCEHNAKVYGFVGPGFEQATVCALVIQNKPATYHGSIKASKLKLFGFPVYSAGETGDEAENISNDIVTYKSQTKKTNQTLIIRHRRLVGAMGIGEWPEFEKIQEAISKKRRLWPWHLLAFRRTGLLWQKKNIKYRSDKQTPATTATKIFVTASFLLLILALQYF